MSADGIGVLGLAVLAVGAVPVLISGISVAGAAYGATKLTQRALDTQMERRRRREAEERRHAAEVAMEEAEERAQIERLLQSFSSVRDNYEQFAEHLRTQRESDMHRLSDELSGVLYQGSSDMLQLERHAQQRRSALEHDWQTQSEQLERQYRGQLEQIAGRMKEQVRTGMVQLDCMKDTVKEDTRLREIAESQFRDARTAVKAVSLELGIVPTELQDSLRRVTEYFDQGMFVNAYSLSSNILLLCYDAISEELSRRAVLEAMEDRIVQRSTALEGLMDASRNFRFSYQGMEYEDDLSRFAPELFAVIANRLRETVDLDTDTPERKLVALQELEEDFGEIMKLAAQKLLYAYAENDSAESITAVMEEQGFEMKDYAYEGDREGNSIHINYANRISHEKLTVVLTPGDDILQVDVHNFGDGSSRMDPVQQDRIREMLEQALNISISCSGRGSVSAHTDAADLSEVRRSRQNV